jgi:hypothetical protein
MPPICDNLFETLLSLIDKPYDYNQLIAKLLCQLLQAAQHQQIVIEDGVPYFWDSDRSKMLSLARPIIRGGANGNAIDSRYLKMDDVATAGDQGFLIPRPATLTGLWGKSRSTADWTLEVRKNGSNITLASVIISSGSGQDDFIDLDLDDGDYLQFYAIGNDISHPIVALELAWRQII